MTYEIKLLKQFYDNGSILAIFPHKKGPMKYVTHGIVEQFYENGATQMQRVDIDGQTQIEKRFYQSGHLSSVKPFKNGHPDGKCFVFMKMEVCQGFVNFEKKRHSLDHDFGMRKENLPHQHIQRSGGKLIQSVT